MADVLIVCPRRRSFGPEHKELAANASCSIIIIVVSLILLRPLMVRHILARAEAYSALGQSEEAQRQCEKALLIDSEDSAAWCQQARLDKAAGDRQAAYTAYQRAVQADSANKAAHLELGMMYVDDGSYQAAIPYLEQVRKLGPEKKKGLPSATPMYHRDALNMLALCYEKVGNPIKMEYTLEEMRVFYPGYGNADTRLAQLKESPKNR
jgi:tetratricopeptide (TPR) repeat protein